MKIKVCGLKDAKNIAQIAALTPDYMGFIFYDKSPRFANSLSLPALNAIPSSIIKTAVFVDAQPEKINSLISDYNFAAIQLHGNEGPEICALFKGRVNVIKAFGVSAGFDFNSLYPYADHVDYFLFDTKTEMHGGSGQAFDWNILDDYELDIPFFLSGGLSLDNLNETANIAHPQFYGIDLNSRFETQPGIKDIGKLKAAFTMVQTLKPDEIRS